MRVTCLLALLFAPGLCSTIGCASMTPTEQGVVGGGLLGGTAGALVGSATGNTAAGAALGAGLGAVAGGVTGNAVEQSENRTRAAIVQASAQQPVRSPLGLTDVAQMAQSQISDPVIINQMRTTGSVFNLSASDIQYLKQNGVSDTVIMEMQQTVGRAPPRVYGRPVRPVYVVEEYCYPPPPPIGLGLHYSYVRRR